MKDYQAKCVCENNLYKFMLDKGNQSTYNLVLIKVAWMFFSFQWVFVIIRAHILSWNLDVPVSALSIFPSVPCVFKVFQDVAQGHDLILLKYFFCHKQQVKFSSNQIKVSLLLIRMTKTLRATF